MFNHKIMKSLYICFKICIVFPLGAKFLKIKKSPKGKTIRILKQILIPLDFVLKNKEKRGKIYELININSETDSN